MAALLRFITSARTSWIVLILAVAAAGGLFALGSGSEGDTAPPVGLPDSAESVRSTRSWRSCRAPTPPRRCWSSPAVGRS